MSFRISTNKYLKENDLRAPEPVIPNEKQETKKPDDDSLESLFTFSETLKPSKQVQEVVSINNNSKNSVATSFSIKNQKRGMEDFL